MTIEPTPEHLEAVGLEWILKVAETPELELTTEQLEALGFEQATPWWQDGATTALLAVIAGMVGGTLVLAVGRSKSPETAAQEPERVTAGV